MSEAQSTVLDASALLALLNSEPGAEVVAAHVGDASISAVNWSEAYGKLRTRGVDGTALAAGMSETGIVVVPFDSDDALAAGELLPLTRRAGLSLADRSCLALAQRLGLPAVTADRAWTKLDVGVEIILIR